MFYNIKFLFLGVWHSDAIWQHRCWTTLVQIVDSCYLAPSDYLNQWWVIVKCTLRNKLQWSFNWNTFFHSSKCSWKCHLQNGSHFVQALRCSPLYLFSNLSYSHIMSEYNDCLQRAQRLSVARESYLTGNLGNAVSAINIDDLMIYLRWLVCHLHAIKKFTQYLKVSLKLFALYHCSKEL